MQNNLPVEVVKPIGLCSDHAGYAMKKYIIGILEEKKIAYNDFGAYSDESSDYPDFAHKLGAAIESGDCVTGITVCGTGNGINMAVNKHQSVRAALCWNVETTRLARLHNNANVLSLPGRMISEKEASDMLDVFFNTEFEGGRHQKRIDKIPLK